jgi:hypothetical protein
MKLFLTLMSLAPVGTVLAGSITTYYDAHNQGSPGGAVYFDVVVGPADLLITRFDTNTNMPGGGTFSFQAYTRPGTNWQNWHNNDWVLVATGTGQGHAVNTPSPITLDAPFLLQANTLYGMALVISSGHEYDDPGPIQFSNSDVMLDLGAATNVPFQGKVFWVRMWNGTMYYEVVPESATIVTLACGLVTFALGRRRLASKR